MPTADDAEQMIRQLENNYRRRVLEALEAQGHDEETLDAYGVFLDNAKVLTSDEIDELRGTAEGDAVAETIVKIQRLHSMTRPTAAGGWRRTARWLTMIGSAAGGAVAAADYAFPFGSMFAAALGIAAATVINWVWLGGRPERRHALGSILSPDSQRVWRKVGERVGPSPAEDALQRVEGEVRPSHWG